MTSKFKDARGCITPEFLNIFGREFCKHEVLWKPNSNLTVSQLQSARDDAYRMIAQALNMSMEEIFEHSKGFPSACLELIRRNEERRRVDARCRLPGWLTLLADSLRLLKTSMYNKPAVITRYDLVRALCDSAWVGLAGDGVVGNGAEDAGGGGGAEEGSSPLLGPRAVVDFAARHWMREEQILPVWRSVYKTCVVKLQALVATGDRAALVSRALRLDAHEREVTDLALLYDADVSQIKFLTPAKVRSLVLLFQLVVAAKEKYDREKRRRFDEIMPNSEDADDRSIRDGSDVIESISISPNSAVRGERCEAGSEKNSNSTPIFEGIKKKSRRETNDTSDATVEESSDYELHTELDLEPDINIISSDTSDNEISNKYLEEYSENNMEVPILRNENRIKDPGIENTDVRYQDEISDIALKSQNSNPKNQYPKECWYEDIKSNSSEEQKVVWALVYTDFIKRGRSASLVTLQHRWVEILHRARAALLKAWLYEGQINVHPLLLAVAHRFPEIVTQYLCPWKRLVVERQIVLESDIKDIIDKFQANDNVLLNIVENLSSRDLIAEYVYNDVHGQSNNNVTNKHLSYQIYNDNTNTDEYNDQLLEQDTIAPESQDNAVNDELNENNCISSILEQIDPSKAKVSIIFDEESDEEGKDDNGMCMNETTADMSNIQVMNKTPETTNLREDHNHVLLQKCNKLIDIAMRNIEKELKDKLDYINNSVHSGSNLSVGNKHTESNEGINENNELLNDKGTVRSQDGFSLLQPREMNFDEFSEYKPEIDEKLAKISRVVISPIEHLPEWKKHSRNGVIKCRHFSVKNFTKPVILDSKQLSKCRRYVNKNKETFDIKDNDIIKSEIDSDDNYNENCMRNEIRIKFEDDNFDTEFDFGDDFNNGITYQKYIELYSMPDHTRKNRITLTKKLKLSRTYFSSNFWSLDRNIEIMRLCKPMHIKLSKVLPRVAKRVELSDINEVRRINSSILTAQVSPIPLDTTLTDALRSSSSNEAVNSTNNSLNSGTKRQTNNSLSSALDSPELLKLLTNYAIEKSIPKKSVTESTTKKIYPNSNIMDSIIETMRLAEKSNVQNSTSTCTSDSLQGHPFPSSDPSELTESCNESISNNISSTDTYNTIDKSTQDVSINNPLLDATSSTIHLSSNSTKELYMKHLQKMKNTRDASCNTDTTKILNVGSLKDMIQLLAKNWQTSTKPECSNDMKVNRSSINVHLKKFEKEQRALVKDISKLSKIVPAYVLNMKPKSKVTKPTTSAKKRKKIKLIKWEQRKEHHELPSGNIDRDINKAINKNSVLDDEDCEPNLVIDERSLELNDNIDINNTQCNKNKEISNKRKTDKRPRIKKNSKNKNKKSKIIEEETPKLNEYQEWQRQKTMALKYFTIPSTKPTKHVNNGCQTNIPIKRKNLQDLTTKSTASDIIKRAKLKPNESDVVCISDTSDDDVLITEWNSAKNTNENTTQPDINQIDTAQNKNNILFPNDLRNQAVSQNVCVINSQVAITQPLYFVLNNQMPISNPDAIKQSQATEPINNPLFLQVFANSTPFTGQTQISQQNHGQQIENILTNDKSKLNIQSNNTLSCEKACNKECESNKYQNTLREQDLSSTRNVIQHVTSQDSRNDNPSTSQLNQNNHLAKESITVKEYLLDNKKLTALIKFDETKAILFFCNKYIILTDVNIPCHDFTYRITVKTKKYKALTKVLVPNNRKGSILLLYIKSESDYIYCKCVSGSTVKCKLCHHIGFSQIPANLLKINNDYYKKICESPIKYVRLNKTELSANSRVVLEGNPDLILVSKMYFKKLTDAPLTYVRILSSVPDVTTLRHLISKKVSLYALDVTLTQYHHKQIVYTQTAGKITVDHPDSGLVNTLQCII